MFSLSLKQILETIRPLVHAQDLETIALRLLIAQMGKRIESAIQSETRNAVAEYNALAPLLDVQPITSDRITSEYHKSL